MPEIIKSIKKTENNHKNSYFDLGRNPMEIVHGPFLQRLKVGVKTKLRAKADRGVLASYKNYFNSTDIDFVK